MTSEQKLIRAARSGDVGAFEELYRSYNDRIYNFVRQIVLSEQDAADIVQETFIRAWQGLPKLRSEKAFAGWLYRIALNRSREGLGRRVARGEVSTDVSTDEERARESLSAAAETGPEAIALRYEVGTVLRKALAGLSADHRAVVAMHYLEDLNVAGVAEMLKIPEGTVLSRLARARAALKLKLLPYVEND